VKRHEAQKPDKSPGVFSHLDVLEKRTDLLNSMDSTADTACSTDPRWAVPYEVGSQSA